MVPRQYTALPLSFRTERSPETGGNRRCAAVNIRSTVRADEELLASTDLFPCHASSAATRESRRRWPQAKIRGTRASSGLFRAGIIDSPPRALLSRWARCKLLFSLRLDRTMKFTACAVEDHNVETICA